MKQKFNLHTHTARCGHAEGLDEQYIHSAIQAGFEVLGFSEHIPYEELRLPQCRMFIEHREEYISSMNKWKSIYEGRIKLLVGYEVEYMEDHLDYLMEMRKTCDYMILGQHCKFIGYEYDCYCSDEDVKCYVSQIEDALSRNFITYVAHPDYYMLGRREFSPVCQEAARRIAEASLRYDVSLEINLNGFHYGKKHYYFSDEKTWLDSYAYPFRAFWEIISEYGCKVLYGFDAHSPISLLEQERVELAEQILDGLPLNFIDDILIR